MQFSAYKTEVIGISAEVAIADVFSVEVAGDYRRRSSKEVVASVSAIAEEVFAKYQIPVPTKHIAEDQNPTDFLLKGNKTLSVKSNQKKLGKVAPQNIGQPTAKTFWQNFADLADSDLGGTTEDLVKMFKRITFSEITLMLDRYWKNLFENDFMIYFFDFLDRNGNLKDRPQALGLMQLETPRWNKNKISFTQTLSSWNESNTVKYDGTSIGEFQVHNNRDCLKFRFNMDAILQLKNDGRI